MNKLKICILLNIHFLIITFCLSTITSVYAKKLQEGYPKSQRSKISINTGWKFHLGNPEESFFEQGFDDSKWEEVSIPHTLKLTSINLDGVLDDKTQLTFQRDVGWYRKTIFISSDTNKKAFLEFEGAHQVTDLWVNGKHIGQHAVGGYTPFIFDITNFVSRGDENQITVLVDNRRREDVPPDPGPFDYIKFSGLYRDVYLTETNQLRITYNIEAQNAGITITTPSVDPVNMNATINIKTVVKNESNQERKVEVVNRVVDKNGLVVLKLVEEEIIAAGTNFTFNQIGGIEEDLQLWSIENPYLYKVNTLVLEDDEPIDCMDNTLGVRKFELDTETGFKLNGKTIELIGFNRHQHYGYIGDAMPNSLHYKDVLDFKRMGFNILRTAHYPHDDAILKACDELGILVYEEAPTWISISQNKTWYENFEKATRTMVRNHRNHPSVVIWGAGINHRGYVPQIHYAVKQEDPFRMTASQSSRWTGWQTSGVTDIYGNMNYGPVIWERNEPLLAMEGRRGPEVVAEYKRDPMMPGIIAWTAHAYYTFHDTGNFEDRTRLGMWDVFRYPKNPLLMWYPSEMVETPMVYVVDEWKEGIKALTIYSNTQQIELFVNDKSIGKFSPSKDLKYQGLEHPPFEIKIQEFQHGKLTAKGLMYGKVVAEHHRFTPEKATAIRLVIDTVGRDFTADGADILVGYAEVVDDNGTIITESEAEIKFQVSGNAKVVGENDGIRSNPIKVKNGYAPVLIQASKEPGEITIKASAKGLKSASATTKSIANKVDIIAANAYEINDFEKVKIDIGASDQLLQFGWIPWNGKDNETSEITIPAFGGFDASITTSSENGTLRWLGEMNVIGKFGFVYGEGALGIDENGLILQLDNLPKGKYKIKTYHHAPHSNTDSMDPNKDKLKTINIPSLPYAKSLNFELSDFNGKQTLKGVSITEGRELQFNHPAIAEITFESNGNNPVKLTIQDANGSKGVWLNGFELMEQK